MAARTPICTGNTSACRSQYRQVSRIYLVLPILIFTSLFGLEAYAQQGSSLIHPEPTRSVSNVHDQVRAIRHQPLSTDYDSLIQAYQTVQAYRDWAYRQPVYHWSLARVKRVNHAEHRAEAELMAGIINGALLKRHIEMGSGVLPILESSVAHLDSATTYFDIIDQFTVANASKRIRTDAKFASQLGDSLTQLRNQVMRQQSFQVLQQYDILDLFQATSPQSTDSTQAPQSSITSWVIRSLE